MIKKKNYIMLLILIILSLLIVAFVPNYSLALKDRGDGTSDTNPITNPGYYDPSGSTVDIGQDKIKDKANAIIGIIATIGTVVSVIVLIILGIKYMVGSVSEKAEYKKTMIPYLIGAIMVFAIPQLVQVIYDIATSAIN